MCWTMNWSDVSNQNTTVNHHPEITFCWKQRALQKLNDDDDGNEDDEDAITKTGEQKQY